MDMRGAQNCRFAAGFFSGMTQVSDGAEQSDLGRHWRAGVDAPSAHHRPEYPSPVASPQSPTPFLQAPIAYRSLVFMQGPSDTGAMP